MTLNLLTQVPEGLVMLSDSMVSAKQTVDGDRTAVSFDHARKLFHLGTDFPAAAMLNGDASIGSLLVSQLLRRASRDLDAQGETVKHDVCVRAIAERINAAYDEFIPQLRAEVAKELSADATALAKINADRKQNGDPPLETVPTELIGVEGISTDGPTVILIAPPQFTIIIGSYFDEPLASSLEWPGARREDIVTEPDSGLWWWGSGGIPITRIIRGVDFGQLASESDESTRGTIVDYFTKNEARFEMQIALQVMPVQQAIYFSEYLADVATGYDRFKVGPHTVGGEIDVVALVDGRLKWIHKQRLRSSFDEYS